MSPSVIFLIATSIKLAIIAFVLLTALAYIQWVERKVIAHVQVRMGPSRVGPHGLARDAAMDLGFAFPASPRAAPAGRMRGARARPSSCGRRMRRRRGRS